MGNGKSYYVFIYGDTTMAAKTDVNIEFENGRMPVLIPSGEIIEKFEGRFQ